MLGRLGMSVGDTVQAYRDLGRKAFTPTRCFYLPNPPRGLYSAIALEKAIKKVIKDQCQEEVCANAPDKAEGKLFRDPNSTCKICVHFALLQLIFLN